MAWQVLGYQSCLQSITADQPQIKSFSGCGAAILVSPNEIVIRYIHSGKNLAATSNPSPCFFKNDLATESSGLFEAGLAIVNNCL